MSLASSFLRTARPHARGVASYLSMSRAREPRSAQSPRRLYSKGDYQQYRHLAHNRSASVFKVLMYYLIGLELLVVVVVVPLQPVAVTAERT